jgi:hypothetical protein
MPSSSVTISGERTLLIVEDDRSFLERLGRGLINTQPYTYGRKLNKREIFGSELIVTRRDSSAVLYLVEEPFDQIPGTVKMRTEAERLGPIASRRDVGPGTTLADKRPDPIGVIPAICEQH